MLERIILLIFYCIFFLVSFLLSLLISFFPIFWVLLRLYRLLCYIRLTIDWFPLLNHTQWPFNYPYLITEPYFQFWRKILPSLRIERNYFEISTIVALEVLNLTTDLLLGFITFLSVSYTYLQENGQ